MLRDVFYYGKKPNVHPRERYAESLEQAKKLATTEHFWIVNEHCNYTGFDWDWDFDFLPDEDIWAENHNNVWPSPYQKDSGTWLCSTDPNAFTIYRADVSPIPRKNEISDNWKIFDHIDKSKFDFKWHPDPTDPPYIYVWGNKWVSGIVSSTIEYHVEGAQDKKYMADSAVLLPNVDNWKTFLPIEDGSFDFTWRPNPTSPPYIYVWGNQWNNCFIEPTITYTVPGATETKYMDNDIVRVASTHEEAHWEIIIPVAKFDFSWRPNPTEPPFIYVFGNKWNDAETEPTVLYKVEGATEYKFLDTLVATPVASHSNWTVRNEADRQVFDFSWRPKPSASPAVYVWGEDGPVYTVVGASETILIDYERPDKSVVEEQTEVIEKVITRSMFYVDRGNGQSQERFNILKERFPQLTKTRYLNSWVDTITRCTAKSETELFWVLNSELDYTDFTFDYNPNPWQKKMIHVFGTQWTHWGNTYLVNKNSFNEDTKYVNVIEHLSMLNFVKDKRATASNCLYDVILVNHGNESDARNLIKSKIGDKIITEVEYEHSYLHTFKNALSKLESKKEHYVWICSSICDYNEFDFSYVCDPFTREQLHVFPSDKQKFGDTFLVNVNKLRELIEDTENLEDIKINYNQHQRVKRLPAPTIITNEDTHVSTINANFNWPYATFVTQDNIDVQVIDTEPMSIWDNKHKNIIVTTTGATCIIVPKEAKQYVKKELYDYPYISKNFKLVQSRPLDVVFLSNGETGADENYEHLLKVTKGLPNRVVRVDGVNGRVAAYHAAAEASETPWMFTVFAKLRVDRGFDWSWQPDRLQVPKHYIFNASNPVNNLVYGHQAMIAYNKRITLANSGRGLDFTLDDEHEVVDMNSGVAMYNTDEWSTWRTAFREALKLKATIVDNPNDKVSTERLLAWSTVGNGEYGQYSIDGALDAIEYYDSVDGDLDKLRLSYDWPWLRSYFEGKYK